MNFFRSKLCILLLLLALGASLGACGYRPEPEKTESGQTVFRLGFSETPSTLDPYTAETDAAAAAISLLYDTLFYADIETGRYINSVCQEYTVQPAAADGARLWTLTLRGDVQFHDGTALTARDVEFSLQSMKDFSLLYGYPGCELIDTTGISVSDDTHLSFLAWGDVAAVEECLSRVPLVPKSVWNALPGMEYTSSGIPRDALRAKESLSAFLPTAETMTGSGLYVWDKYENGVLTLRRSEDYWNGTARAEIVELHFGCNDLAAAMENNLDFINTEPHMAAILQGLIVSMEEAGQDREMIHSLKTGLFGPLAGLGDAIWWYTAMPIIASICCSLATQNNVLGPIFYILFWALTAIFSRIWFVRLGYNAGVSSIKFIGDNAAYISKAAGILGVMVVGGLIPSYVSFAFPETLVISSVSVQGIFDSIMPNILPLGFVFLLYWLFKKKNVNTMKLILLVIALSVVLSFLGIM